MVVGVYVCVESYFATHVCKALGDLWKEVAWPMPKIVRNTPTLEDSYNKYLPSSGAPHRMFRAY